MVGIVVVVMAMFSCWSVGGSDGGVGHRVAAALPLVQPHRRLAYAGPDDLLEEVGEGETRCRVRRAPAPGVLQPEPIVKQGVDPGGGAGGSGKETAEGLQVLGAEARW